MSREYTVENYSRGDIILVNMLLSIRRLAKTILLPTAGSQGDLGLRVQAKMWVELVNLDFCWQKKLPEKGWEDDILPRASDSRPIRPWVEPSAFTEIQRRSVCLCLHRFGTITCKEFRAGRTEISEGPERDICRTQQLPGNWDKQDWSCGPWPASHFYAHLARMEDGWTRRWARALYPVFVLSSRSPWCAFVALLRAVLCQVVVFHERYAEKGRTDAKALVLLLLNPSRYGCNDLAWI